MSELIVNVGKTYITRDGSRTVDIVSDTPPGRKPGPNGELFVGVMYRVEDGGVIGAELWLSDGHYTLSKHDTHPFDLVAEHVLPFETFVVIATRKNGGQEIVTTGTTDIDAAQRALKGFLRQPAPGTRYRIAKVAEVEP